MMIIISQIEEGSEREGESRGTKKILTRFPVSMRSRGRGRGAGGGCYLGSLHRRHTLIFSRLQFSSAKVSCFFCMTL